MSMDRIVDFGGRSGRGRCLTFYSYKGGVGRTLAVAGVAAELAMRHRQRVLVVDWDLDTPGLHLALGLDEKDLRDRPGLIEYIDRSGAEFSYLQSHLESGSPDRNILLSDYVTPILLGDRGSDVAGQCDFMAAGRSGEGYLQLLQRLDWRDLYANRGGFWIMERLKLQAAEQYDFILIDARAGRSDTALIPLVQLSDLVILVFAVNKASIAGTTSIASVFTENAHLGRRPPPAILVPSLVWAEPIADTLRQQIKWMSRTLIENGIELVVQNGSVAEFALPYDPSITDKAALSDNAPDVRSSGLYAAYGRIAELIMSQNHDAVTDRR